MQRTQIKFANRYRDQHLVDSAAIKTIHQLINEQAFVGGKPISDLEDTLSGISKSKYCVTCGNGTDALEMAVSIEIKHLNEVVFCPSYTFEATIQSILSSGATPWFVDCEIESFTMCPKSLKRCISRAKSDGYSLGGVVTVDIFGNPCDYKTISDICLQNDLWLIGDCAQSLGARFDGRSIADYCTSFITSFYPTKPMGGIGDGGAFFCNDADKVQQIRCIKSHVNIEINDTLIPARNSRMDTIGAAYLLVKSKYFQFELSQRQAVLSSLGKLFRDRVSPQRETKGGRASWCNYSFRCGSEQEALNISNNFGAEDIECRFYYRNNLHLKSDYTRFERDPSGMKNTEILSQTVLSIPLHGNLSCDEQLRYKKCIS